MDQFNDVEFTLTVEYQELINDSDTQYAGEKLLLKNKLLKMNVDCTSLNIFKYISDDLFKTGIAAVEAIGCFELTKANIEKINTLNGLDSDERNMEFKIGDKKTIVSGKTYELVIGESNVKETASLSIFKEQYASLDVENYDVDLGEDRLVYKSKESETTTVISKAEKE
jgi:hypothetical protein